MATISIDSRHSITVKEDGHRKCTMVLWKLKSLILPTLREQFKDLPELCPGYSSNAGRGKADMNKLRSQISTFFNRSDVMAATVKLLREQQEKQEQPEQQQEHEQPEQPEQEHEQPEQPEQQQEKKPSQQQEKPSQRKEQPPEQQEKTEPGASKRKFEDIISGIHSLDEEMQQAYVERDNAVHGMNKAVRGMKKALHGKEQLQKEVDALHNKVR